MNVANRLFKKFHSRAFSYPNFLTMFESLLLTSEIGVPNILSPKSVVTFLEIRQHRFVISQGITQELKTMMATVEEVQRRTRKISIGSSDSRAISAAEQLATRFRNLTNSAHVSWLKCYTQPLL